MLRHAFALSLLALPAAAQERMPSHCIEIAQSAPGIQYASAEFFAPQDEFTVRLRYIDHSMFLLRTPGGLTAVTDFYGFLGPTTFLPDVVTMNNAHSTHWTANPDPAIPHVLRGWAEGGTPADHYLELGEMLVRNVPTDVRGVPGRARSRATRSSSSRSRASASAISATSTTNRTSSSMRRSAGSTWSWRRSTAA
jgi:hypothetical protein